MRTDTFSRATKASNANLYLKPEANPFLLLFMVNIKLKTLE